jgi:hypothetical protein
MVKIRRLQQAQKFGCYDMRSKMGEGGMVEV